MSHARTRLTHYATRSGWRPQLTQLEDRTTPVTISGNTVTLDDVGELLTISTATAGTYTLNSSTDGTQTFTPAAGLVTVIDSATGTGVTFATSTATYAHSFAVTLDNAPQRVLFLGSTPFGANSLSVTTTRNIEVSETNGNIIPTVSTTSGDITLAANLQATPTLGDFSGVYVDGVVTSVSGTVSVFGRGGTNGTGVDVRRQVNTTGGGAVRINGTGGEGDGVGQSILRIYGVYLQFGLPVSTGGGDITVEGTGGGTGGRRTGVYIENGIIRAGGTGAVSITGTGAANGGDESTGVTVFGTAAVVTSSGGNVSVTGTGGGGGNSRISDGVTVAEGATITSGGTGRVSVIGTGGTGNGEQNIGVNLALVTGSITSGGGDVVIRGTGGSGTGDRNYGFRTIAGARVSVGGTGTLTVTGTGGAGGGNTNHGVFVESPQGGLATNNGAVTITGTAGSGASSEGIRLFSSGFSGGVIRVQSGGNAPLTLVADSLSLVDGISAGTGTVTLRPLTPTTRIDLGGPDVLTGGPRALGLTDRELDNVTAGTLVIGDTFHTADIRLVAPITRPVSTGVNLTTGGNLRAESTGRLDTAGGLLVLYADDYTPTPAGTDFAAGLVDGMATVVLTIDGPTQSTRWDVDGAIQLSPLFLQLRGSYTPVVGDVFTLVTATNFAFNSTFSNVPNGGTVTLNGATLRLNYTANTLTATVVGTSLQSRVVTAVGDVVRVHNPADGSSRTFVPFPGFTVSVAAADLNGDNVPDVVIGAGPGGGPHVRVFDGATSAELASFFAFDVAFRGGVNVAAGGGFVALGAGPGGGPHVKVVAAGQLGVKRADGVIADSVAVANFFAFDTSFAGGVSVALGDLTSDGTADLVVGAGAGGGPHVKVIDGSKWSQPRTGVVIDDSTTVANFFAFDTTFTGGVNVAATAGRFAVGAGAGGEPQVKVYRTDGGLVEERNERAFDAGFRGGVRVEFADADADGDIDLLTAAGPGGGPHLKAFNVAPFGLVRSEFVADPTDTRGVVV